MVAKMTVYIAFFDGDSSWLVICLCPRVRRDDFDTHQSLLECAARFPYVAKLSDLALQSNAREAEEFSTKCRERYCQASGPPPPH